MGTKIVVIDPPGGTGQNCSCGKEAMFILSINESNHHLCEHCIAVVAKQIIDGLT